MERDKALHRLGLRAVEELPREVLVDVVQVGVLGAARGRGLHGSTNVRVDVPARPVPRLHRTSDVSDLMTTARRGNR